MIVFLINQYKSIFVLDDEFVLFTDGDTEIIGMRGEVATRNKALMNYWRTNATVRAEYAEGKLAHAYSRQAYYRWKDALINSILEHL